jgi:hypothetical protein
MPALRNRRWDASGDMTFGHGARDYLQTSSAVAQRVVQMLRTFLGECFQDLTAGVPWIQPAGSDAQPVMGGAVDLGYAEAVIKAKVLALDGVASIVEVDLQIDSRARQLHVAMTITTTDGDVQEITTDVVVPV